MADLKYLVLLDTDKIKEYLFSTNRLKEIRGASAILNQLNRKGTRQILVDAQSDYGKGNLDEGENFDENWKDTESLDWQMVYFGGGAVMIRFRDQDKANQFCSEIERLYHDATDGIASTTGIVVEKKVTEKREDWIKRAQRLLRRRKDSKYWKHQPLSNPHFKVCESSGIHVAEKRDPDVSTRLIHRSVYGKRSQENAGIAEEFRRYALDTLKKKPILKENWREIQNAVFPEDLNQIGELSRGYVGFIYADGNRMGTRFEGLNFQERHELSSRIDDGTRDSLFGKVLESLRLVPFKDRNNQEKWRIPFQILMLGGDDLMVVAPADKAIELATDFCESFKDETAGISISAGVLIAHAHYPIHRMMEHAEQFLKSAKKLSNKLKDKKNLANKEVCTIDFMVLKGALLQSLKVMRENEMETRGLSRTANLKLYQRPYRTDELKELVDMVRQFKTSRFPHSRLKSMYRSLYRGRAQATLDLLMMTSRLEGRARDVMTRFLADDKQDFRLWKEGDRKNEYTTPLIDLIELYDFIPEQEVPRETSENKNHADDESTPR